MATTALLSTVLGRVAVGALTALASLRYGAGIYAWREANRLETPSYEIVRTLPGGVELRRYDPYIVAETTVEGSVGWRDGASQGFRACAGYIFGKNAPPPRSGLKGIWGERKGAGGGEKMAMTAPVRVSATGAGSCRGETMAMTAPVRSSSRGVPDGGPTRVSFVIGSKYDLKSVPRPLDGSVSLRKVKGHYLATRRFSGPPPKDERVQKERARIESAMGRGGIKAAKGKEGEETLVYGYHDPFITPNVLRRNEVAVLVDPSSVEFA